MATVPKILFLTVISFLFVHELDAIRQHEWRFFFAPVSVSDETAYRIFAALHLPVFVVLLVSVELPASQIVIDTFAVAHGVVHFSLRNHPKVTFDSWFSRFWIVGATVFGALHLFVVL